MLEFKFLSKNKVFSDWMDMMDDYHLGGIVPSPNTNRYLGFDMDLALISTIRYRRATGVDLRTSDTPLERVGLPINNMCLRILNWNTFDQSPSARIEIYYRLLHPDGPTDFTYRALIQDFERAIEM